MTDADEREEIRRRKRERLADLADDDGVIDPADVESDAGSDEETERPTAPVHVEGDDHLDSLVDAHDVVLVDFYADWCGPCKMVAPVVETLHEEETAVVAKVDIDVLQGLAARQNVRSVPTMVLYVDGEPVERVTGAREKGALESLIGKHA